MIRTNNFSLLLKITEQKILAFVFTKKTIILQLKVSFFSVKSRQYSESLCVLLVVGDAIKSNKQTNHLRSKVTFWYLSLAT